MGPLFYNNDVLWSNVRIVFPIFLEGFDDEICCIMQGIEIELLSKVLFHLIQELIFLNEIEVLKYIKWVVL